MIDEPSVLPQSQALDLSVTSLMQQEAVTDFGYREEFSTAYGQAYVSTADEAIEVGMREARDRVLEKEKDGFLFVNNKERFVIVRDGVLMLWSGPGSKYEIVSGL